jgi:hypothetical protein
LLRILDTWGIAQNRKFSGARKAAMYFKQSSTCIKALVTMSFRHCTAFSEFSSYFNSWIAKIEKLSVRKENHNKMIMKYNVFRVLPLY